MSQTLEQCVESSNFASKFVMLPASPSRILNDLEGQLAKTEDITD